MGGQCWGHSGGGTALGGQQWGYRPGGDSTAGDSPQGDSPGRSEVWPAHRGTRLGQVQVGQVGGERPGQLPWTCPGLSGGKAQACPRELPHSPLLTAQRGRCCNSTPHDDTPLGWHGGWPPASVPTRQTGGPAGAAGPEVLRAAEVTWRGAACPWGPWGCPEVPPGAPPGGAGGAE